MGWPSLVVVSALVPACSFAFVKDPDEKALRDPHRYPNCTEGSTLPIADALIGAAMGTLVAVATYTAIESANDECEADGGSCFHGTKPAILATFLTVSPWWISSAVGFSDTARCRAIVRERRNYLPPQLPSPVPPPPAQ